MKYLLTVALAGCSLGVGSPYVGKHRPAEHVEVEACLVDDAGACSEKKQILSESPARHFWGVVAEFPGVGAAEVTKAGETSTQLRLELSLEVIKGFGKLGLGVRGSWMLDGSEMTTPLTAIGRYSLSPRLGIYAGAGYSPFSQFRDNGMTETSLLGARVIGGLQVALSRVFVLAVEGDTMFVHFDGGYRSIGLSVNLGLFL